MLMFVFVALVISIRFNAVWTLEAIAQFAFPRFLTKVAGNEMLATDFFFNSTSLCYKK